MIDLNNRDAFPFYSPARLSAFVIALGPDLPKQEASDFDYNDFKFFVYGVDAVPEPSSLVLLGGVPLSFAVSKLRRWL